jgi:hypothetical protein
VHYQIRVRGRLSQMLLGAFPELRAQLLRSETLLAGQLPDQAALFGVLHRIEALGLELLEVLGAEDQGGAEAVPGASATARSDQRKRPFRGTA